MTTTTLTDREKQQILAALRLVSPTGGGSEVFTLYRKLAGEWNLEWDDALIQRFASTVIEDARDAGAI